MNEKKENDKISKQTQEVNNKDDILIKLLHSKLDNKLINLPNNESIKLLLLNDDVKKLINYTLNKHSEITQEIEIRKKVNFYFVNNKKIDEYIQLRNLKNEKMKKLDELKKKLKNIKEQRKNCISKNEELIKEINTEDKNDKLAKLKLKILNSSSNSLIMDIQNDYKKYTYLNGYKYSHLYPKKNIGGVIENEDEEEENENSNNQNEKDHFNKVTNNNKDNKDHNIVNDNNNKDNNDNMTKEKEDKNNIENAEENNINDNNNEEQVSFITVSNEISSMNNSQINQIINLPKLTEEEIRKYTKYTQKLFFDKTINELKSIKNSMTDDKNIKNKNKNEEQKSLISVTSTNSNNNKLQKSKEIIAVENKAKQKIKNKDEEQHYKEFFSEISSQFKNDIEREELNVSKNYTNKVIEAQNDITYNQALDELNNIKRENKNKISGETWQKIVDISKVKLIKDINDKYFNDKEKDKDNNKNNAKIKEVIIPKCIIEKNPQDTLNFFRNVINTYKKYKLRTNNFINKRLFPSLLQLDERYTDFMTTLINEYDYFIKLDFENMKEDNDNVYSLKKFKYDLNSLKKSGIKCKYDLFGFYISNLYMKKIILENDKIINDFNRGTAFEVYLETIKKNDDIKKAISKYIKNTSFNQHLSLYYDKEEINLIKDYMKEFLNIDYINNLNPFEQ